MFVRRFIIAAAAAFVAACGSVAGDTPWSQGVRAGGDAPRILVFTKSAGYRHASIEPGVAAIRAIGEREGWVVEHTEDADVFAPGRLDQYDALVLLHTTSSFRNPDSEWFQGARREALQAFVHRGGGVVGIHAAADSHYNWPWYRQMIGGAFERHPPGEPPGRITIVDADHPATRALPRQFTRADEWYYYVDFNPTVRVLATLDPASIGQTDSNPNPISWVHEFEGGRVFYTGMGHTPESYEEEVFLTHLTGGLRWALRLED